MNDRASPLLEPFRIGALELRNRVVMAPMSRYFCPDGVPTEAVATYYERRARHGVGLIITEGTYIGHPSAASYEGVPNFHGAGLDGWAMVRERVHAAGGRIFPQLWHTGSFRRPGDGPDPAVPAFGPSENLNAYAKTTEPTKAMTEADIAAVIDAYAQAAADAQRLGFDGVELHGAHGYLIDEFLWATTNRRSDGYGGDLVGRTRFGVEVVKAVRRRVGPDFPVSLRFSQWKQQDYAARLAETPDELRRLLEPFAEAGVSLFHASTRRYWEPAFDGSPLTLAGWVKRLTGRPALAVGSVGLDQAGLKSAAPASIDALEACLDRGEFDLIAVGRALLADPHWLEKIRDGRWSEASGYDKALLERLY